MKGLGYLTSVLLVQLVAAELPLHHGFTCKKEPTPIAGFDPSAFKGTWYMYQSTKYNKEKYGCVTWTLSDKDANDKINSRFTYMKTFDWNLIRYDTGRPYAKRFTYSYDDTGKLTKNRWWDNVSQIIHTDNLNYAVVYECSMFVPFVMNMRADQIHIYTKSQEPLDDATMTTIETAVKD